MATPTVTPYGLGMRHTGSWATDQRPQTIRQGLLYLYPNGSVTLTAMLSMMKRSKPKDPKFEEFVKNLPAQAGAVASVYTNIALSSEYTTAVTAVGTVLYAKVALAVAQEFREGHDIVLEEIADQRDTVHCLVTTVVLNGASSAIGCQLMEATTAGDTKDPASADRIRVIGNANIEGGIIPDAVNYNPTSFWNYAQIFRTPYEVTGTQLETELVTGDTLKEERREKFELHGIEMEKAFLWGLRFRDTVGGKFRRHTMGMVPMIQAHANANDMNYTLDSDFSGNEWQTGGKKWFDQSLEVLGRYGPTTRMAFCGSGALLGIQQLAESLGTFNLAVRQADFGITIVEWVTPGLTLLLKTHPLMSSEESERNNIIIFPPENIEERPLRDTRQLKDAEAGKSGYNSVDGIKEEWLTETGLYFKHPSTFGVLRGVGLNNAV